MKRTAVMAGGGLAALVGSCIALAGCDKKQSAIPVAPVLAATLPGGLQPQASILDLMLEFVDPNADELWESVATVSTRAGIEERQPRTDAEWKAAHRRALTLIESANLLVIEGRLVAHPGQILEEPGGDGDFTPAQAQAAIDRDRGSFVGFARELQSASSALLDSIGKRDVDAFLQAGGLLDEACENCHRKFWYPNAPLPPGA